MAVTYKKFAYDEDLHTQDTDTGTSGNDFAIGDGADSDKTLTAANGDANEPKLKHDSATNKWQFSNDGLAWTDIGSGGVGVDDFYIFGSIIM